MTPKGSQNGNAGPEKPIAPEELEKAKKLQDALASMKENPDSETIAETLNDSIRTEGDLSEKELRQLKLQIEGALAKVDPTLSVPEHILTNDGMVQLAISSGLLNPSEYKSLILQSEQIKKDEKKGNSAETGSSRSIKELDEQFQDAKSQFLRTRNPSERRMYTAQMRQIRKTIEEQLGYNYSLYRHELREEKERHRREVTETYYDSEGNHHQYNRETGAHVVGHARRREEPGVTTDELADAKYRLDRGIGRGGRRLPQNRINSDGSVNWFTQADMQGVQDFINARSARRLARLEQQEGFAARHAEIMDVLTNPGRLDEKSRAPIDYSDPSVQDALTKVKSVNPVFNELTNMRRKYKKNPEEKHDTSNNTVFIIQKREGKGDVSIIENGSGKVYRYTDIDLADLRASVQNGTLMQRVARDVEEKKQKERSRKEKEEYSNLLKTLGFPIDVQEQLLTTESSQKLIDSATDGQKKLYKEIYEDRGAPLYVVEKDGSLIFLSHGNKDVSIWIVSSDGSARFVDGKNGEYVVERMFRDIPVYWSIIDGRPIRDAKKITENEAKEMASDFVKILIRKNERVFETIVDGITQKKIANPPRVDARRAKKNEKELLNEQLREQLDKIDEAITNLVVEKGWNIDNTNVLLRAITLELAEQIGTRKYQLLFDWNNRKSALLPVI